LGLIGPLAVVRCGGGIRSLKIRMRARSATEELRDFEEDGFVQNLLPNSLFRNALEYIHFVFNTLEKKSQGIAKYGS
jgi:hypothetical protein